MSYERTIDHGIGGSAFGGIPSLVRTNSTEHSTSCSQCVSIEFPMRTKHMVILKRVWRPPGSQTNQASWKNNNDSFWSAYILNLPLHTLVDFPSARFIRQSSFSRYALLSETEGPTRTLYFFREVSEKTGRTSSDIP